MVETVVKEKLAGNDNTNKLAKVPVFLPEHILEHLFGPLGMEIPHEAVAKYWLHSQTHDCPWKHVSPCGNHIPLGLYGDAAKFAPTGEKIIAYFLNIILWTPKSSRMSRWLLFTLENDVCLWPQSLYPLFRVIVTSLLRCYNGLQIKGQRMCFAVCEMRGDWEWHVQSLDLQRNWRMHTFCWRCDVSKKPEAEHSMWDFSDQPSWVMSELNNVQFLARMVNPRTARPLH